MTLSDAALREIAEVFRKHVDQESLEKVVDDLLDSRGELRRTNTTEKRAS